MNMSDKSKLLYEKPKEIFSIVKQNSRLISEKIVKRCRSEIFRDWALYSGIGCLLFMWFIFIYIALNQLVGTKEPIKITDIIGAVGQVATACTFALAFWQYIKNKKEKRQVEIATEIKKLVTQMVEIISQIKTKEHTDLDNLDNAMKLLANLGIDFETLFNSMHEDVQKAIARMYWQGMFFNHLLPKFKKLELIPILKSKTKLTDKDINLAIDRARERCDKKYTLEYEYEYKCMKEFLNDENIKVNLREGFTQLDEFVFYFINPHRLDDYLHGYKHFIDIRVIAPLLAAAEPDDWTLNNKYFKTN